jgi:hypothetical protein
VGPVVFGMLIAIPGAARAERCSDGTIAKQAKHDLPGQQQPQQPEEAHVETLDDDCIERNIYWMPGVFGAYLQPTAGLGPFYGAGVQFAPYQWSHNNDRFGPSQGSLIMQAALLKSPRSEGTLALFELGATASFERNSSRRWLVPYFGATLGGLSQAELGTSAYAYPFGGIHLFWHRNLMLDAEGGYHFPFQDIDHAKGARAQLSARFSMW